MRASPGAAVSRSSRSGPAAAAARSAVGAAALPAAAGSPFYEQRGRNADDAQLLHRLHRGIDVDRERANADFLEELPHGLNSLAVDRERDHLERRPAQLLLQAVERRHLLAARHAPRRPDVEQHRPAAELGKRPRTALSILELKVRHLPRRGRARDDFRRRCAGACGARLRPRARSASARRQVRGDSRNDEQRDADQPRNTAQASGRAKRIDPVHGSPPQLLDERRERCFRLVQSRRGNHGCSCITRTRTSDAAPGLSPER